MKTRTHYLVAVGALHGFIVWQMGSIGVETAWMYSIWSFGLALLALLPNYIDRIVGPSWTHNGVLLGRYRHPLSHSPWTLGYFIPLTYLADVFHVPHFSFLVLGAGISWASHLLLDAWNPEGIPLGTQATITNHPVRHYRWTQNNDVRKLRIGRVAFNDLEANIRLSRMGILGIMTNLILLVLMSLIEVS